jgi:hypothetical protein
VVRDDWEYGKREEGYEPFVPRERRNDNHLKKLPRWRRNNAYKCCYDVNVDNPVLLCLKCKQSLQARGESFKVDMD